MTCTISSGYAVQGVGMLFMRVSMLFKEGGSNGAHLKSTSADCGRVVAEGCAIHAQNGTTADFHRTAVLRPVVLERAVQQRQRRRVKEMDGAR
eukprot:3883366-Prymnesium_polylepis.1